MVLLLIGWCFTIKPIDPGTYTVKFLYWIQLSIEGVIISNKITYLTGDNI